MDRLGPDGLVLRSDSRFGSNCVAYGLRGECKRVRVGSTAAIFHGNLLDEIGHGHFDVELDKVGKGMENSITMQWGQLQATRV